MPSSDDYAVSYSGPCGSVSLSTHILTASTALHGPRVTAVATASVHACAHTDPNGDWQWFEYCDLSPTQCRSTGQSLSPGLVPVRGCGPDQATCVVEPQLEMGPLHWWGLCVYSPGGTYELACQPYIVAPAGTPIPESQQNTVSIEFGPSDVPASGFGVVSVTITDTSPHGDPVAGAKVVIQPPVEVATNGQPDALLCDSADKLVSPVRLSDGSLLGQDFTATTDREGQVRLTLYVGAYPGIWLIDAYQPGHPGAAEVSKELAVRVSGRAPELPDGLGGLLLFASERNDTLATLGRVGQDLPRKQRSLLQWLGQVDGSIDSVGYAPIYATDAAGQTNAGVVLFANSSAVRRKVIDYLDGVSTDPPSEGEAIVIDVANMSELLGATRFFGHPVTNVPYRLPALYEWEYGTTIVIPGEYQLSGQKHVIPIPARGRAHLGLVGSRGNEDMLYGWGPYLPVSGAGTVALERCLGA